MFDVVVDECADKVVRVIVAVLKAVVNWGLD
jgi:hypothetical protein